MANKRSRKAAAARKRAAALAAQVVPMDIDKGESAGDVVVGVDAIHACLIDSQGAERIQEALGAALLHGIPRGEGMHRTHGTHGMHANAVQVPMQMQRLSSEELRMCHILAQRQALSYMGIAPPLPICPRFNDHVSAPLIVTPAMAAARFASTSNTSIIGHTKTLNEAYETAENEFVLTQQQDEDNLYIFHAYDDDDIDAQDTDDTEDTDGGDDEVEIVSITDLDSGTRIGNPIRSANDSSNMQPSNGNGNTPEIPPLVPCDFITQPAIMKDALNAARRLQRRPNNSSNSITIPDDIDDDSDDEDNNDGNNADDEDDGDVSGSSSSLWTSFGRLFAFGRSPSYQNSLPDMNLNNNSNSVLGDTGPKSPDRFPPPILNTSAARDKKEKLFLACSPITPTVLDGDEEEEHCASCRKEDEDKNGNGDNKKTERRPANGIGNRRVLRAARSLKQQQGQPASTRVEPRTGTAPLAKGLMDELTPLLETGKRTNGGTANEKKKAVSRKGREERKRGKKNTKVKRRPRVRMADDE